jgi:hypothetical protein
VCKEHVHKHMYAYQEHVLPVRKMCNTYVPVSTECLTGCYACTCVVVPNNKGNSGSLISENFDEQTASNTLSFVLLAIQVSKSKYRPFF